METTKTESKIPIGSKVRFKAGRTGPDTWHWMNGTVAGYCQGVYEITLDAPLDFGDGPQNWFRYEAEVEKQ